MITTLDREINTYNANYDVVTDIKTIGDLNNKLFCTFTDIDNLDPLLEKIKSKYTIIYNKLFVLEIVGKDEYVITYNVDQGNVHTIPENTILVHRKKESNTLYTINALNETTRQTRMISRNINFIKNIIRWYKRFPTSVFFVKCCIIYSFVFI